MTQRLEDLRDDVCLHCGGEIDRDRSRSSVLIYCSIPCRSAYLNGLERNGRLADKAKLQRHCARCDAQIPPSRRVEAIYCSSPCKRRALNVTWRQRNREHAAGAMQRHEPVACRWCRTMFVPKRVPAPVLCSLACNMAERRARAATPALLTCVICSAEYRPKARCVPRRTCSESCRQALRVISRQHQRPAIVCEAVQ